MRIRRCQTIDQEMTSLNSGNNQNVEKSKSAGKLIPQIQQRVVFSFFEL